MIVVNHVPAYPSYRKIGGHRATSRAPARTIASTGCRCSRSTACRWCWNTTTTPSSGPSRCSTAWRTTTACSIWATARGAGSARRDARQAQLPRGKHPGLPPVPAPHPGRRALSPGPRRVRPGHGRMPNGATFGGSCCGGLIELTDYCQVLFNHCAGNRSRKR